MKRFTVVTEYETYENCYFEYGKYMADNSVSLEIWNDEDGPIADMTRCLGDSSEGKGYLDMNNSPWSKDLVAELGIGEFTGKLVQSGFCAYPEYKFDMEKVKEYGRNISEEEDAEEE